MATLVTLMSQEDWEADLHVLYQTGDGSCPDRPSYHAYRRLANTYGGDPQLSPFDERVREVCRLHGVRLLEHDLENDCALDSGAWYKFIQRKLWRPYESVLFLGEGTLLTRPTALSAMRRFALTRDAQFIASGHEKRRLPKRALLQRSLPDAERTPMDVFHDEMTSNVFNVFCRDPSFAALFERWSLDLAPETQHHVPDLWMG